jgi:Tfp pilus assembly PilM family ATPase
VKIDDFNFSRLFSGLHSQTPRLGVFLEERVSRIVRVDRVRGDEFRIAGFGEVDAGLLTASDADKQRFKMMIRQIGGGLTRVAASIEHPSLRIRRMNLAKMPERDLLEAIRWNLREFIEGPVDNYIVGQIPLEEEADEGRVTCLAYGLTSEVVESYSRALKDLGLKPVSLEPSVSALLAAFQANNILGDDRYHVCVFTGETESFFSVMKGHSLLFCRPLAGINEDALVKLLVRNLSLPEDDIVQALTAWMGGSRREDDLLKRLAISVGHFFSQFVVEVQRSIDAFCILHEVDRVDILHLCGRGVFYPGIIERTRKTLGIETVVFNPFERLMDPGSMTEEVARVAPLYAVAVGLAIP